MPFFDKGRRAKGFDAGIEQMIAAVLVSPEFLFRTIKCARPREDEPAAVASR